MEDNLKLWERVCKTNPADTKEVNFGRKIIAIDPYSQIYEATKEFGAAGEGWGWEVTNVQHLPTNELAMLIRLWHGSSGKYIEQWGQASYFIDKNEKKKDTDCFKKATTDGITKCLSYLGFNADIFLGKYEDNKYVAQMMEEFRENMSGAGGVGSTTGGDGVPILSDNDKSWIEAIKSGASNLEDIESPEYREFIKDNLE